MLSSDAGEVLAFGACQQATPLLPVVENTIKSELATQHVTPAQHFMVMTTAGDSCLLVLIGVHTPEHDVTLLEQQR